MIGAMQWAVSLGRLDITTAVMTMSGYQVAPRQGHLDRCKRIYGYLLKMRHSQIRINTAEPDFLINKTLFDWYSKKQATVETATYGSEFMAARHATEQILDHRMTLRYLGVPIRGHTYMFGDNKSVVGSGSKIDAKLHKRHTALSFHRVREAIAAGVLAFYHIPGTINPADILSKH
jgi:hypothetical protein